MNIIFLASGAFAVPSLEAISRSRHKSLLVITAPDKPAGRGRHITPTPAAACAVELGLPLYKTAQANSPEVVARVAELKPDVVVVIAFGQKLSENLLAAAPLGGINLHASLLPAFRGAAPIQWAILSGQETTGVSIIRVSPVIDGGEILSSRATPIGETETAGELHDRLALLGAPLVVEVLDQLQIGAVNPTPQDLQRVSQAPKLNRDMAWVDFSQPAATVSCRIRGLSPWPACTAEILTPDGQIRSKISLLKCRTIAASSATPGCFREDLSVACGTGAVELLAVQPPGKRPMDMTALANGYGIKPGWLLRSGPQNSPGEA
jgi:methionyl-tRNA formyltransferase